MRPCFALAERKFDGAESWLFLRITGSGSSSSADAEQLFCGTFRVGFLSCTNALGSHRAFLRPRQPLSEGSPLSRALHLHSALTHSMNSESNVLRTFALGYHPSSRQAAFSEMKKSHKKRHPRRIDTRDFISDGSRSSGSHIGL